MTEPDIVPEHVGAVQYLWYGHRHVPGRSDFEFSWKAVKAVAAGDGELSATERQHLLGKMCAILTPPDVVDLVMRFDEHSVAPEELLARIDVPEEVRPGTGAWVVYEGLSVAISDGELAGGELRAIHRAAEAMRVRPETVDALIELCRTEASIRNHRIGLLQSTIPTPFRFAHDAEEATGREVIAPPEP